MSASTARVGAVIRKELAELPRNCLIVGTAAVLPAVSRGPAPGLGAHTAEVLRESGCSPAEIDRLTGSPEPAPRRKPEADTRSRSGLLWRFG